jgi:beta-barrel assembly-enhancing protease
MSCFFSSTRRRRTALVVLITFVFTYLCLFPSQNSWALSLSQEKELGKQLIHVLKERMTLVEDGEILTYVQSVGNRIVKQLGLTPYQYQFFVVDASIPNAFAVPGGYIFIYRGLVEMLASEGELAAIFSHELAHIQARHIHRSMEKGKILTVAALAGLLAGVFLGMKSEAGQALTVGSAAGAQSLQLKYSRDNEEEADQLGLKYLTAAGYPPKDMANAMRRLGQQSKWLMNSKIPSYLSTHPALGERVLYLEELIQRQKDLPSKVRRPDSPDEFSIMQATLVAHYADPQVAQDRFQNAAKKDETSGVYGLGRLCLRQGKVDEAIQYLQDAARRQADSTFILSTLGSAYIQQGRLKEAQKVLQSALVLDPKAAIVHFRLALVLKDLGQKEEALQHLQQIEELSPTFPEIDYHLGVLLGQVNRLGPAHFHLGRYYEDKQDWGLAIFHYEKARAMISGDPQRIEEIDYSLKEVKERKKKIRFLPRK